jgi:hypothetical protein
MVRKLLFVGGLALSAGALAAGGEVRLPLTGSWTVTGTADAQETTSLSSDDVDKLTGTELMFSPELVQFSDESCDRPVFKQARQSTSAFFRREYKIDPKHLRLPDQVTELEISCQTPSPISFIYFRDKRHIVFYWKGFFLNAEMRIDGEP